MKQFTEAVASELNVEQTQVFPYWKGRVGLYALLKAMQIGNGDEVIIPAFTCVVVPNAIIYLGAKPIYVDVNKETYNTTIDKIKEKTTDKTKCILIQNTFGLSTQVEEIIVFAKSKNIPTIEDCTHGFGGTYNGQPNGTFADASFFSTQWNKPFSTGIGGFVYVKNTNYLSKLIDVNKGLITPSFKEKFILSSLIKARKLLLNPFTYSTLLKLYRFLSKIGLVVGSSSKEEIEGIEIPDGYFKGFSVVQAKTGLKKIKKLDQVIENRIANAKKYSKFLESEGRTFVSQSLEENHSFLKYPILVKDREKFKLLAEKVSINLGDWFISMIHPIENNLELWHLDADEFPIAKEISEKILNLDTDTKSIDKVLKFLAQHKEEIL
ncbi:DegT/DnrJ/EryC1/StrS family aminotransferase [bacterium]|jgi:perosamine synthetase|nr:DegT/DnrJ/EryC1/StrS family aminotransferase [bacterium]MDB9931271.1 DegT/DnrJ/EryC1/StrS family aminotransferase [Flavobacteriales bacterium]